jgi:Glycosyl hydrolase family 115/Gylcosyl hydrolase family 115 C-terminal domain
MKEKLSLAFFVCFISIKLFSQDITVQEKQAPGFFPLVSNLGTTLIYIDPKDYWLVHKAAELLQQDLLMLTEKKTEIVFTLPSTAGSVIIIGSVDSSAIIKKLSDEKKINTSDMQGKWESFRLQTINNPLPGIHNALVIAGSDKRGTAYGVFELSRKMGVSPWYWWADVPVKKKKEIYIKSGIYNNGSPSVKYRGIFINDEAPAFSGWTKEKFGGVNHLVYEKVFELLLRLKANYLWPAMWGNAFNDDDTLNPVLANKYGIVMGTTHHEPMLRAQQEWKRYGKGQWNYDSNEFVLKDFWKKGIEKMDSHESIVSIGMRGDGDMPMTVGSNISLLERIVHDQRKIIEEVTQKPASTTPQLWALYKEVQDYYDKGMRVPDDVTLLLCDDNWGNIRKLPKLSDKPRAGGYGIYYHFDYVGDPRNYKWLNTNSIPRVWEQMNLAYQYGADRIWIVNVGDIKPMEFPIQFFLDFAWDTKKWNANNIGSYARKWAEEIFGRDFSTDIGELVSEYTKYNSRRKPELLSWDTYSLIHFSEAEKVVKDYNLLAEKAERIYHRLPENYKNAYYQLVLYPVKACANLNKMYVAAGLNRLYATQGRASANDLADSVKKYFDEDARLASYYNTVLSDGKWDHMMDQTHIGYTYWQQPERNIIPKTEYISLPDSASMAMAIEGSNAWWPNEATPAVLPELNSLLRQTGYIELYNRGKKSFEYNVKVPVSWVKMKGLNKKIEKQRRLSIQVDWNSAPHGIHKIPITITGPSGSTITFFAVINNYGLPKRNHLKGFIETNEYVSMEASHYSRVVNKSPVAWQQIPGIGRTGSGMTITPVTADKQTPGEASPRLEYNMMVFSTGRATVYTYLSPTLNFNGKELQYAISFDDGTPQIINLHPDQTNKSWENWVANNIIIDSTEFQINKTGIHTLKFWMVDPGIVLQKIVVGFPGIKPSYLGPPETKVK